jgi:hypothetical protein
MVNAFFSKLQLNTTCFLVLTLLQIMGLIHSTISLGHMYKEVSIDSIVNYIS